VALIPPGKRLPLPASTVRQLWGAGVRAGMYPLSESEVYWFTCFNAPEVTWGHAGRRAWMAGCPH
jgi:hypothetical protein